MRNNTFFAFPCDDVSLAVGFAPYPKKIRWNAHFDVWATRYKPGGRGEIEEEFFVGSFRMGLPYPDAAKQRHPPLEHLEREAKALYLFYRENYASEPESHI